MSRFKFPFLCLLFLFSANTLFAQLTIKGTVKDKETGDTIPGANVYLSNTTIGASTNAEGVYKINDVPSGIYVLVFSFVGYYTRIFQIKIQNASSSRTINMELKPNVIEMGEVEVVSSNKEWEENYKTFKKEFIGSSRFAAKTIITNKEVLSFRKHSETGELLASTDQPLIVNNNALGYTAYVELDQFRWTKSGNRGFYRTYPRFEEMKPKNKKQKNQWQENRQQAYLGSFRHFMKSLYNRQIPENNFTVLSNENPIPLTKGEERFELLGRQNASQNLSKILKGFRISNQILVNYTPDSGFRGKKGSSYSLDTKRSRLSPNTRSHTFFIDNKGNLLNPTSVALSGEWIYDRFADQLPFDYSTE